MGLYSLFRTFLDACERIRERYGPPEELYSEDFMVNPRPIKELEDEYYKSLHIHDERLFALDNDKDVLFVLSCFDGDLFQGFEMIVDVFDEEIQTVMHHAIEDNKILFFVYISVLVLGFFIGVFRRSSRYAKLQAKKARDFVRRMPIYSLTQLETNTLALVFGEKDDGRRQMSFSLHKRRTAGHIAKDLSVRHS